MRSSYCLYIRLCLYVRLCIFLSANLSVLLYPYFWVYEAYEMTLMFVCLRIPPKFLGSI
jgi:hypothetical protein